MDIFNREVSTFRKSWRWYICFFFIHYLLLSYCINYLHHLGKALAYHPLLC